MFTGIIDHTGVLKNVLSIPAGIGLWVAMQFKNMVLGESIALNGICLTVAQIENDAVYFELSPETCLITTAGTWQENQAINVERALRAGDLLGGHFVSGHVDTQATITGIQSQADFCEMQFTLASDVAMNLIARKGSIAVDGVSLTVNDVEENTFLVTLIPHTLQRTQLGQLVVGDKVNIEFDLMQRMVARQLEYMQVGGNK